MFETIKSRALLFLEIVFRICRIKDNCVFFNSFAGQYNDNPKYISEKLHEMDKDVIIIWAISKKFRGAMLPEYIKSVKHNSLKHIYYKSKAHIIVENGAGDHLVIKKKRVRLHKILKKKKQLNISTWHGTPLKKIGVDIEAETTKRREVFSTSDIILAGCDYVKRVFESCFLGKIPVWMAGTPRNDILFGLTPQRVLVLKEKLELPNDKKIVLYAPTYRDNVNLSGINQMGTMDFSLLFSVLERTFGGGWVFIFRVHQLVTAAIDTKSIAEKYAGKVMDGNKNDDMAEYLAVTDLLITDYSGSMFDFALTGKPCFLFSPDIEAYEHERGLYMGMNELPFSNAGSFEELIANILIYDERVYQQRVERFMQRIGNREDGKASERVAGLILKYIKTGKIIQIKN